MARLVPLQQVVLAREIERQRAALLGGWDEVDVDLPDDGLTPAGRMQLRLEVLSGLTTFQNDEAPGF
jgi:hypothetical protein